MKILYSYLKDHKWLLLLTLFLATINQVFSLLDPLIFRHVIDNYAMKFNELSSREFFNGVMLLLGAALRSEEHTSELQSLMRISYAVYCLKQKNSKTYTHNQSKHKTNCSI